jgi:hypothetical protein
MLIVHIFDVTKMALYLCGFSSKKPQPSLNHEKKKKQIQLRNVLQNAWLVLLKTVMVIRNRKSLRNCHSGEALRDKARRYQGITSVRY